MAAESQTLSAFKARLINGPAVLAPGAFDALSALLIEQAGFEAIYVSGASIAYTQLGRPDVGLVTATQVADVVMRMSDRVQIPLIADIDTGFGNAINAQHTVRLFERAGASALQIEDQTSPKRCGHLQGKSLISTAEMAGKIKAAVDARSNASLQIIARTDAIAVDGMDAALERAAVYREAGADVLFVEAPQTVEQLQRVATAFPRAPLVANMVEGGATPLMTANALAALGFKLVIAPGAMVRAFAFMAKEFLSVLRQDGETARYRARMLDFKQINDSLGLPTLLEDGRRYDGVDREPVK